MSIRLLQNNDEVRIYLSGGQQHALVEEETWERMGDRAYIVFPGQTEVLPSFDIDMSCKHLDICRRSGLLKVSITSSLI